MGWEVDGHELEDISQPFRFGNVSFVRFQDKDGRWHDVRSDGWAGANQRSFVFSPVDLERPVRYKFREFWERLPDQRFRTSHRQVIDLSNDKVVASYTTISWQWTKPERVILAAPTDASCWNMQGDFDKFFKGLFQASS